MKIVLLGIALLCIHVVSAMEITEIMYNPLGSDTGREWVEVYSQEPVNISELSFFNEAGNHKAIRMQGSETMQGYIIISNDADLFLLEHVYDGNLLQASFSLKNGGENIGIRLNGTIEDNLTYSNSSANGNGKSLEKTGNSWGESIQDGGTPGFGMTQVPEFSVLTASLALVLGFLLFTLKRK